MPIIYNEENRLFKLDSKNSSYVFYVFPNGHLVHLYYGAKVPDVDFITLFPRQRTYASFSPISERVDGQSHSPDVDQFEYPTTGVGDYRLTAYSTKAYEGNCVCDLFYREHRIYAGKPELPGLPATYTNTDDEATTLEVDCEDPVTGALVTLIYTVFEKTDAITRSARIKNNGKHEFIIEKALSSSVNLPRGDYDIVNAHGQYARERTVSRSPLGHMTQTISSTRGASGHVHNPFMIIPRRDTTEDVGDCYGFVFVYSSNFVIEADLDPFTSPRVTVGINPEGFEWHLAPGETFQTPEAIMTFSEEGIGGVSRSFHRLMSKNLIRGKWRDVRRPLLINSWEAAYFNFDDDKLVAFAKQAAELGIEMLVMDDGWFGKRNNDTSSLGDWYVNEEKLKGGLTSLIERVNEAGLKFGIWYEPEMISPDSDLYRAHPDWCLHVDGRRQSDARCQYMLDMTRQDVRDNIFGQMYDVISKNKIDYIKWDFNRNFSEAASETLGKDRQGELAHRYMLGTYELLDRLTKAFPDILFETCSGGGGRFDAGMLYYSPQIWTSDNTCGFDRLPIQFGTSMAYPASTMGAHVSYSSRAPFDTRAAVAMWGTFGYELDPLRLTDEQKEDVKRQIATYHKYADLIRTGDLYRYIYPHDGSTHAAWSIVAADKSEALLTLVTKIRFVDSSFVLRLRGLDPDKMYRLEGTEMVFSGAMLMKVGYNMTYVHQGDGAAVMLHFVEEK